MSETWTHLPRPGEIKLKSPEQIQREACASAEQIQRESVIAVGDHALAEQLRHEGGIVKEALARLLERGYR